MDASIGEVRQLGDGMMCVLLGLDNPTPASFVVESVEPYSFEIVARECAYNVRKFSKSKPFGSICPAVCPGFASVDEVT